MECSVDALVNIRDDKELLTVVMRFFSDTVCQRIALPTCPDCCLFLEKINKFTKKCLETHSILMELRKKCQPEEYAADPLLVEEVEQIIEEDTPQGHPYQTAVVTTGEVQEEVVMDEPVGDNDSILSQSMPWFIKHPVYSIYPFSG